MVEITGKTLDQEKTEEQLEDEEAKLNKLTMAADPGANDESMDGMIQRRMFMDQSVSVGEGEENDSGVPDNFRERRDLEQYFFTVNILEKYMQSFFMKYQDKETIEKKVCLICCPSLAKAFYEYHNIVVTCLDIDKRFENLPGFKYFDLQ